MIYDTTAAGIAATTNGQFFIVKGDGTNTYALMYKNVAAVATLVASYPSKTAFDLAFDMITEWMAFGGLLGIAFVDTAGKIYGGYRQDDALFRSRLALESSAGAISYSYNAATGYTDVNVIGLEASASEQIVAGNVAYAPIVDANYKVFGYGRADGSYYFHHLVAGKIDGVAGGAIDSSAYYFTVEDVSGLNQVIRYTKATGVRTQMTTGSNNSGPHLSSDGSNVIYSSDRTTPASEFFQSVAGGEENRVIGTSLIVPVGNSLSTSGGLGYYTGLLALRPNASFHLEAVSGQRSDDMAYRLGATPFSGSVAGASIPASGAVVITGLETSIFRLWQGATGALRVSIAGVPGNLALTGYGTVPVYTFTRDTAGSIVAVSNPVVITPTSGVLVGSTDASAAMALKDVLSGICILWLTYNDIEPGFSLATSMANIAAIVNKVRPLVKKMLIVCDHIGLARLTDATARANGCPAGIGRAGTEAISKQWIEASQALTAATLAAYPGECLDLHAALIADGYTQNVTVLGVVYPLVTLAILGDGVHPTTALGKTVEAGHINDSLLARGL
ncbi:hypothetical protein [Mesorhizobium sp. M0195]|uniref:hypothetical protein n=1 Tax=Mesorhizobium sp. M0195 TaxID=2956910 RepID=UPI0033352129